MPGVTILTETAIKHFPGSYKEDCLTLFCNLIYCDYILLIVLQGLIENISLFSSLSKQEDRWVDLLHYYNFILSIIIEYLSKKRKNELYFLLSRDNDMRRKSSHYGGRGLMNFKYLFFFCFNDLQTLKKSVPVFL